MDHGRKERAMYVNYKFTTFVKYCLLSTTLLYLDWTGQGGDALNAYLSYIRDLQKRSHANYLSNHNNCPIGFQFVPCTCVVLLG